MKGFRASGPLEDRNIPSRWAELLDVALPALDHAMPDEAERIRRGVPPRWTLGGGTALALRMGHRISDDIDVFLSGVALSAMTPARNPAANRIAESFQWPGHYLKYERSEGEVDFLASALQTAPGFTVAPFRGRGIALETVDEVIVKKIRYRAAQFTPRDAFDLAAALEHRPEIVTTIAQETGDAMPRLGAALGVLERRGAGAVSTKVRATEDHMHLLDVAVGRSMAAMTAAINMSDPGAPGMRALNELVQSVDWFAPGSGTGRIRFGWSTAGPVEMSARAEVIDAKPMEAKALLIGRWRTIDPKGFSDWDGRARQTTEEEVAPGRSGSRSQRAGIVR